MTVFVHPTAEVEEGVALEDGTRMWHQAHIRRNAMIGSDCNLGKNVFVDEGVVIGNRVKIQNNVSVHHGVGLADDVFVAQPAVFTDDLRPRAGSTDWMVSTTVAHRGASSGANATIVCGNKIGACAMVGAGSVVTRDVATHQLVVGNPARQHGWVCNCGEIVARGAKVPVPADRCAPNAAASRRKSGPTGE